MKYFRWIPFLMLLSLPAQAQLLINPVGFLRSGHLETEVGAGIAQINYDTEVLTDGDLTRHTDRRYLFAGGALGLTKHIDICAAAAYSFYTGLENGDFDDEGTIYAVGLRALLWTKEQHHQRISVHAYVQGAQIDETYVDQRETDRLFDSKAEAEGTELTTGLLLSMKEEGLTLYGGIEVAPYTDLNFKGRIFGSPLPLAPVDESFEVEMERSVPLYVKAGTQIGDGNFKFRGEATIFNKVGVSLSLIKIF